MYVFDTDASPITFAPPTITATPNTGLQSPDTVNVSGTNFLPGKSYSLFECTPGGDQCVDTALGQTTTDTNGAFGPVAGTVTRTFAGQTRNVDCGVEACVIRAVSAATTESAETPIAFDVVPPTAVDDSATVAEDSIYTGIGVLANDTDPDGGPKNVTSSTQASHGDASFFFTVNNGQVSQYFLYKPAPGYCGPDSFTYTLNGGSTATVSITVTCVDDPPTAVGDSATVAEGSGPNTIDVLANDTDSDGGPKSVASVTQPAHGTAAILNTPSAGSGISYRPNPGYCGPDSFTYALNGGSSATVTLTVTCDTTAPQPTVNAPSCATPPTSPAAPAMTWATCRRSPS